MERLTRKRQCYGSCGCKTKQAATVNEAGLPVWECLCCGTATPRRVRTVATDPALDALFNELTGE